MRPIYYYLKWNFDDRFQFELSFVISPTMNPLLSQRESMRNCNDNEIEPILLMAHGDENAKAQPFIELIFYQFQFHFDIALIPHVTHGIQKREKTNNSYETLRLCQHQTRFFIRIFVVVYNAFLSTLMAMNTKGKLKRTAKSTPAAHYW